MLHALVVIEALGGPQDGRLGEHDARDRLGPRGLRTKRKLLPVQMSFPAHCRNEFPNNGG